MDLGILFLNAGKNSSTKNLILKSLIANENLSNIRLQYILRKKFGKKISYQAIRQALLELSEERVIEKQDKEYRINKDWFQKVKYELNLIEKSLEKRGSIKIVDNETTQISLKNLYELGHFILYSLEEKYFDISKNQDTYMQLEHLWIPFSDQNKRERLKQLMSKNNINVTVKNKSALDKMLYKWYKKFVKVKLGVKFTSSCDYIIHNNTVIQIYINPKLKKQMDKLYSLKSLASLNLFNELSDMTYKKNKIEIIITRNKTIAEQIKNNLCSLSN